MWFAIGQLAFFTSIYLSGKLNSKNKDFFHIRVPKIINKIFFVNFVCGKIPLHVFIFQVLALLSFVALFSNVAYAIITSQKINGLSLAYTTICFYILVATAIYAAICDLFLRVLCKK